MIFPLTATSQSVDVLIVDDTGLPTTGLVAATMPTLTYSLAGANADVVFPALSDLALITTAYASGGVKERGNGRYRLDVPDAVFTTAGQVTIRGEAAGKRVIVPLIDVQPKVDLDTIKTNAVVNAGTITFPTTATLASTTNLTAGTIAAVSGAVGSVTATVTVGTINANVITATSIAADAITDAKVAADVTIASVTGAVGSVTAAVVLPGIPANWITAAGITAAALNGKGDWATINPSNLTAAQIATGIWQDTTAADFTTALSVGKSVMNGVALGTGLTINAYTGNTVQTGDAFARLGDPVGASISVDVAAVKTDAGTILNRLGAITGTGINTVLGFFRAVFNKAVALTGTDLSTGATGDNTTDSLEAIRDRGDVAWITGAGGGTGARTVDITVNDGTTALQGANVRVTQGAETYVLATSAAGLASFSLNDFTWLIAISKAGYSFTSVNLVVAGNVTITYSMTVATITPSTSSRTTCYLTVQTIAGVAVNAQSVYLEYVNFAPTPTGEGVSVPQTIGTTDATGLVQFVNIHRLARVRVRIGTSGPWRETLTADAATTPLLNAMGLISV